MNERIDTVEYKTSPMLHDVDIASSGIRLLVERGYSRAGIVKRMQVAAPNLVIYSTLDQPLPQTEHLYFPSLNEAHNIASFNQTIEEYGIHSLWLQNSAQYELSEVKAEVHTAGTADVIALVNDKIRFTDWLSPNDPYQAGATEVLSRADVATAYTARRQAGREVCIKPVNGVYGQGYWHLTERSDVSLLNQPDEREMHPAVYLAALAIEEIQTGPQRLMVMDWLPGPEVSIDLLCWRGRPLIHSARTKMDASHQYIESEHPTLEHAYSVAGRLALHGIISMQYRLDENQNWKMLEVNPRPAGGSIYSEDVGFGIITSWAQLVAHSVEPDEITQVHQRVLYDVTHAKILERYKATESLNAAVA